MQRDRKRVHLFESITPGDANAVVSALLKLKTCELRGNAGATVLISLLESLVYERCERFYVSLKEEDE